MGQADCNICFAAWWPLKGPADIYGSLPFVLLIHGPAQGWQICGSWSTVRAYFWIPLAGAARARAPEVVRLWPHAGAQSAHAAARVDTCNKSVFSHISVVISEGRDRLQGHRLYCGGDKLVLQQRVWGPRGSRPCAGPGEGRRHQAVLEVTSSLLQGRVGGARPGELWTAPPGLWTAPPGCTRSRNFFTTGASWGSAGRALDGAARLY